MPAAQRIFDSNENDIKKRPRAQNFGVLRTWAEVKAGLARFYDFGVFKTEIDYFLAFAFTL